MTQIGGKIFWFPILWIPLPVVCLELTLGAARQALMRG
ncbi:hypothetical protein RR42_m1727 [Cupriavidus basilensis]|uniref:Uncharacterized protein n=1 Tax=Cupriavidus basilensis TaxID=68895 RepID=A0A0C4YA57_9BURK|nr:hypothetical protein RR42_m1727 [Cupriavidus basilensis]